MSFVLWSHLFYINVEAAFVVHSNTSKLCITLIEADMLLRVVSLAVWFTLKILYTSYISTLSLCSSVTFH